jgi:hypothetical protein
MSVIGGRADIIELRTANMNYCLCHGRDWGEKGAVLSEMAQASRRQCDPDIGRLSDDMPLWRNLILVAPAGVQRSAASNV